MVLKLFIFKLRDPASGRILRAKVESDTKVNAWSLAGMMFGAENIVALESYS